MSKLGGLVSPEHWVQEMALEKKHMRDIPSDAVILTEEQALMYQSKILNNWNVTSDIFGYKYGSVLLGSATMLAGMYINGFFRMKFKLLHYGRVASYLPMAGIPGAMSFLFHQQIVLRELVLMKQEKCPVCIQMRSAALQGGIGCILPLVLAPITSLTLVQKYNTYNVPYISREPMKVLQLIQKIVKPQKNILFGIFVMQALLGSLVTYLEAESIYKVNLKLIESERNEDQL
ncbi:hypothetical protein JTB14_012964 [Gonioctena quinquepunctata]|nr:hypothetical protein JTB14_012964 [Gonioctena quinquepunctata]